MLALVLVAAAAALPFALGDYGATAGTLILFSCYLAQTWNLAGGYAGLISLGNTVFLGIGGYASTVLFIKLGLSPWLGMFAGAALAAAAGALMAAVVFRYRIRGVFFAVVTLSAAEVVRSLFTDWNLVGGSAGLFMVLADEPANMMFTSRLPYYEIMLGMVVVLALVTWRLERSWFGHYLKAIREDEDAAEATGVPTFRCKVAIMAVTGFFTAFAGTFYAQLLLFIVPDSLFGFDHVLTMLLGAMVGGPGTVGGPILGSVLFGLLSEATRNIPFGDTRMISGALKIVYAVVLMIVVVRLPGGIVSLLPGRKGAAS
jgi:branched-chain amino acid transport system permease protein